MACLLTDNKIMTTVIESIKKIALAFLYCFRRIAGIRPSETAHSTAIMDITQSKEPKNSKSIKNSFQSLAKTEAPTIEFITNFSRLMYF